MSDLRPRGEGLTLGGEERHLLFSLNAVDELQDHFDCSLEEVIERLTDKREAAKTLRYVVTTLLNDEADRTKDADLKHYTERETGWLISNENLVEVTVAVLKAYGISLPEPDEFASPNVMSGQTG